MMKKIFCFLIGTISLLAIPFIMSACKTAGDHARAESMMNKGEVMSEKNCPCAKSGQEGGCKNCQGSCGEAKDKSATGSCGGK